MQFSKQCVAKSPGDGYLGKREGLLEGPEINRDESRCNKF